MVVPEKEKGVKSFRIPKVFFHAAIFLVVIFIFLLAILSYDYWKILRQVYENKHLTIENRQLKEQIQLFQMKINSLTEDIERINIFEKKLRIITGIDDTDTTRPVTIPEANDNSRTPQSTIFESLDMEKNIETQKEYQELKTLYEQKIATTFGLQTGYTYTKEWSELTKRSFSMANQYAKFDYMFNTISQFIQRLETNIHELDQYLLDKDSFIKSTPTLIPTRGWITSYYGQRPSPYSGRIRMHEGIDVGAKIGTPVISPADGLVTYSGRKPAFGLLVQLDHGYGLETIYAHCDSSAVKVGQQVKRGTLIARVGNSGYSTGPHVHYEIRVNGVPVDPLYYILD